MDMTHHIGHVRQERYLIQKGNKQQGLSFSKEYSDNRNIMIVTISLFTLLLLQLFQLFAWIVAIYFMVWVIALPVKFFWRSITYKTRL